MMKSLPKEANVDWEESIVAITSDKKTTGNRFLDVLTNGYTPITIGVIFLLLFIFLLDLIIKVNIGGLFLFGFLSLTFLALFFGVRQRSNKGSWY